MSVNSTAVKEYLLQLQAQIVARLELLDGKKFIRDQWTREPGSIGIGAGGGVDGQVLVIHDLLGLTQEFSTRFLRRYLNLAAEITGAVGHYVADVKSRDFPNEKEQYD